MKGIDRKQVHDFGLLQKQFMDEYDHKTYNYSKKSIEENHALFKSHMEVTISKFIN